MLSRLKFEIQDLFEKIYNDRFPESLFSSEVTTFADIQGCGLQSIIPLVNKLREYGHSDDNIKSRVFVFMENEVYLNYIMLKYLNLPVTFFIYKESIDMKFDAIVGNPPYQVKVGPRKTEPIWDKFVFKGFDLLKENGYMMLIHPSGWRNIDGRFKKVQDILKSKTLMYLEMHSEKDGMEIFGASIIFDLYVVQNKKNEGELTTIKTFDGNIENCDITKMDFIPNSNFEDVLSLVANSDEDTVDIIHSYSNYETRKGWMSKEQINEYIYPCVCNVAKSEGYTLMYSNTNQKGHFGVPKVICGGASSGTNYFVDTEGQFGITQFSFGIVEKIEKLESLKIALKSKRFQELIKSIPNNSSAVNFKILKTFRKNFWEEFINE